MEMSNLFWKILYDQKNFCYYYQPFNKIVAYFTNFRLLLLIIY